MNKMLLLPATVTLPSGILFEIPSKVKIVAELLEGRNHVALGCIDPQLEL